MLTILQGGKFSEPFFAKPGDSVYLTRNDKIVYRVEIHTLITHEINQWLCFKVGNCGLGYAVGGDDLIEQLLGLPQDDAEMVREGVDQDYRCLE
jgi:hypothetical protein